MGLRNRNWFDNYIVMFTGRLCQEKLLTPLKFRLAFTAPSSSGVFPNPFTDATTIKLPFNDGSTPAFDVNITDAAGRTVYEKKACYGEKIIWNAGNKIEPGIYFLKLLSVEGNLISTQTVLKQ